MKQTTKTLVGLLALLVIAGAIGGAALWTGKDEAKKAEAKAKREKLFDFDKAQVKSLRLKREGKLVAALAKDDKGWKITEPIQAEGDDTTVDSLLTTLAGLKQKKDLGDEKDLKPYGLEAPRLELSVKLDDGKEQGLQIGGDNSFDNALYVKKMGDPVVRLADAWEKSSFDKQLLDLRNKSVAHLADNAEVKRVEVTGVKSPYVLEKDGGAWKFEGEPADSGVADRVVVALKQLRATGVADDKGTNLARYGLDKPKLTARVAVASGKDTLTRTVLIGQAKGDEGKTKTYAKRDDSPVVFQVDEIILKDLDKQPFDFQDKQLVRANRDQIRKFIFESAAGRIEVTRTKTSPPDGGFPDEQYAVISPRQAPARKVKMSAASYSIVALRAEGFDGPVPKERDLKKYGLDKPRTITLLGEGDKVLARVRFGAEKDGRRYAVVDGINKLARVARSAADELPWTLADVLETPPPGSADGGVQAAK